MVYSNPYFWEIFENQILTLVLSPTLQGAGMEISNIQYYTHVLYFIKSKSTLLHQGMFTLHVYIFVDTKSRYGNYMYVIYIILQAYASVRCSCSCICCHHCHHVLWQWHPPFPFQTPHECCMHIN